MICASLAWRKQVLVSAPKRCVPKGYMGLSSFWLCPAIERGAMGTKWDAGGFTYTYGNDFPLQVLGHWRKLPTELLEPP